MVMHAARAWRDDPAPQDAAQPLTLLELVSAVADFARSDDEVVATVAHLINTGAVTLVGNFRGAHVRVS
jgi:hypothetical protein